MKELLKLTKAGSKSPYLVFHLIDNDTLLFNWNGFLDVDNIIKVHEQSLELIKKHKIVNLIEDVRKFSGPFSKANDWFINTYTPSIIKLGVKKTAVILNDNVFTELSVTDLKENPEFKKMGLLYRVFGSMEDATEWIREDSKQTV
ncbi:hypothetical protein C900_02376 [Fulvivirga imtechensis AK7]|uniref:STAS/SEC14 domain-containing protein n=1 Tax=Fulvivirga imtechensis AK7 TaxID=1237149 RepID=L8JS68_9BACT|nr:hypothetical protein [Fulvivirga imtechensis]ELR71791.1 hypothetical protein C900_02376 [Fulvivirga imtechensis AK7]